jgi:hypothetical protein
VTAVEIERRADKLAGHLQTAQQRLETATESIRGVQDVLDLGVGVGAPVDAMSLEKVLEALTSIQDRLQETERLVNAVREFTVNRVGESEDDRLSRILMLLGNTEVIAGAMDDRSRRRAHSPVSGAGGCAAEGGQDKPLHCVDHACGFHGSRLDRGWSRRLMPVRLEKPSPKSISGLTDRKNLVCYVRPMISP